jgi:prepilin peptidase CpaA
MQIPLLFFSCLVVIGWDLVARRVPNPFLIVCAAMQCALTATNPFATGWAQAAWGFGLAALCLLPFYVVRLMGAGDVKFGALLGLMLGPKAFLTAWVIASLLAGLHSVIVLQLRANPALPDLLLATRSGYRLSDTVARAENVQRAERFFTRMRNGRKGIPYAAYLAIGALSGWWTLSHVV